MDVKELKMLFPLQQVCNLSSQINKSHLASMFLRLQQGKLNYKLTNYSPETGHVTISPPITAQYQSIVHFCQNLWKPGTMEKYVLILLSRITSVWK